MLLAQREDALGAPTRREMRNAGVDEIANSELLHGGCLGWCGSVSSLIDASRLSLRFDECAGAEDVSKRLPARGREHFE
jgi:hypothetical protein